MSIRFAFRAGKSEADLTTDSIRLMAVDELEFTNQSAAVRLIDLNYTIYRYLYQVNGVFQDMDSLTAPTVDLPIETGNAEIYIYIDGLWDNEWDDDIIDGILIPYNTAQAYAFDSESHTGVSVTWESSNECILEIDASGEITTENYGFCEGNCACDGTNLVTITATTANGIIAEFILWVDWPLLVPAY